MDIESAFMGFGLCILIFWLLGIIGNICLIVTYCRKDRSERFNRLMITLASFDLSFLVIVPCVYITFCLMWADEILLLVMKFLFYLSQCALKGSVYTTVAISIERYLVVFKQKKTEKFPFRWTLLIILVLAFVLSAPSPLWTFFSRHNLTGYEVGTTSFTFVVTGIIPSAILITLNALLYKKLKAYQSNLLSPESGFGEDIKEEMMKAIFRVRLTISITGLFVISQLLLWTPLLLLLTVDLEFVSNRTQDQILNGTYLSLLIGFLVCTMNSSLNYYLYLFLSCKEKKRGFQNVENQRTTEREPSEQTELKTL